jgi:hypothetical protein
MLFAEEKLENPEKISRVQNVNKEFLCTNPMCWKNTLPVNFSFKKMRKNCHVSSQISPKKNPNLQKINPGLILNRNFPKCL